MASAEGAATAVTGVSAGTAACDGPEVLVNDCDPKRSLPSNEYPAADDTVRLRALLDAQEHAACLS